ncbi:MAG TPA: flagellar biosynthesis protein FliQ [Polyangia bacterium]
MSSSPAFDVVIRSIREGLILVLILSAPPLLASLVVGFVVGIFQAATQIQDQTVSFVPKLVVVVLIIIAVGPIMGAQLLRFMQTALAAMPTLR